MKDEIKEILISNIKNEIKKTKEKDFALCIEQWKQLLDYITYLQEQVYEQKELINTVIDDMKHFHLIYNEDGKLILSGESILAEIRYFIDKLEGTIPITMTPFEHEIWEKENRIKGEDDE